MSHVRGMMAKNHVTCEGHDSTEPCHTVTQYHSLSLTVHSLSSDHPPSGPRVGRKLVLAPETRLWADVRRRTPDCGLTLADSRRGTWTAAATSSYYSHLTLHNILICLLLNKYLSIPTSQASCGWLAAVSPVLRPSLCHSLC